MGRAADSCDRHHLQNTLKHPVTFTSVGLHSGRPARMVIRPASAEHGIWFRRTDLVGTDNLISAVWNAAQHSPLCTTLVNDAGVSVSTVEHVMAALAGCGVHNALIDVDGPEVPIMDGSAAPFVRGIMGRGLRKLAVPVRAIEILKEVRVERDGAVASLAPSETLTIDFHIDFEDTAIGRQNRTLVMNNGAFARELCDSRTFCRQSDVDAMHASGLALGGAPGDNAVVFDGDVVTSPGGLRHKDEPVRHKMLDALGDLALAGGPILGHYTGIRAGHTLTNMLLRTLFTTPGAARMIVCTAEQTARLPGVGLHWAEIPEVA